MTIVTFGPYSFDTDDLRGRGFLTPYVINGVTYELETAMRVAAALDIAAKAAATTEAASAVAVDRDAVTLDREAVHQDRLAAEAAAAAAQTWNPANYVAKRSFSSFIYETGVDFNALTQVYETKYFQPSSSLNGPFTTGGLGYYVGLAGGDAGGSLGLQLVAISDAGKMFWRDKYTGGWREFWHTGNLTPATAPNANTMVARTPDGSVLGNHLYARTSDTSANGVTLIALGSNSDSLDAYFQMNSSTNTTAPAGARGLAMVVNTGAFGIYTGRISPTVQFYMDPTTKQFTFYKGVNPSPVTVPFSSTITLDFASSNRFDLTATGSFTLANPSNMKPGQVVVLNVTNSVANVIMSRGSAFKTKGGNGVSLSTTAGSRDKVIIECISAGVADITIQKDWK